MYSHRGFFIWSTQNNLLFIGEWEHPLPWHGRERLWPYDYCYHIWLLHLESKAQSQDKGRFFCPPEHGKYPDLRYLSSVLHYQREQRQWRHMHWCFTLASQRSQPSHDHRHVALSCIQWQPVPWRRTDPNASFLHTGRHHHLHPWHGSSHLIFCKEWQGIVTLISSVFLLLMYVFGRNLSIIMSFSQEPKLAFEGVIASELYPCVLFYSSNPGEKVLHTVHT